MVGLIIIVSVVGLVSGALARLLIPGRQNLSLLATTRDRDPRFVRRRVDRLGLHHERGAHFHPAGLLGSVLGAVLVLVIYARLNPDVHRRRRRYSR